MQTARTVEAWEVALHNDAIGIYERLAQDAAFMALDKFAKAEALKAAARADNATPIAASDATLRLVQAANGQ